MSTPATATGCRERGCPWKGDPAHCPWHSSDDDYAWDSANGYARYRGAHDDKRILTRRSKK